MNFNLDNRKILILYNKVYDIDEYEKKTIQLSFDTLKNDISSEGIFLEFAEVSDSVEDVLRKYSPDDYIIFNWCEQIGEDPHTEVAIPAVLKKFGFIFTGSDEKCMERTLNKINIKVELIANNISTPTFLIYRNKNTPLNNWKIYPAIVKPGHEHGSNGITEQSVVDNFDQLEKQVESIKKQFNNSVLVEEFIDGQEYNAAFMGNFPDTQTLPISSLDYSYFTDYHKRICSFDAKWSPDTDAFTKIIPVCPPKNLNKDLEKKINAEALKVVRLFECKDYARVDIRIKNNIPYIFDINADPDITIDGGFVRSAMAAGYNYGQTFLKICEHAYKRNKKS